MKRFRPAVLLLCALLAGCTGLSTPALAPQTMPPTATPAAVTSTPNATPTETPAATASPAPQPTEINIMAVGDIMYHHLQIGSGYDKTTKTYNYDYCFQYVKDILAGADLTMGNFETTLSGTPYTAFQKSKFSTPDALADSLKVAGFDVLTTGNNHQNDKGSKGFLRTLQVLGSRGFATTGTRADVSEKPYIIEDVKGIKVGIAAYSFCTRPGGGIALDYVRLKDDVKDLINVFSYSTIDQDLAQMSGVARQMRADGAEIVVFCTHCGTEFTRNVTDAQKKLAQGLCDAGVDVIFGCHPHWLQPFDMLTRADGGKTAVIYSLGNFISCERLTTAVRFKYSEDSLILNVHIEKKPGGTASVTGVQYLPIWTFMYSAKGQRYFTVIPLQRAIASPDAYGINIQNGLKRAMVSLGNTEKLLAGAVDKGLISEMK